MFVKRWSAPGGYREALAIGLPLVVSMASHMVMTTTDRIFLGNYSMDALAAALPAGVMNFLFVSFFLGVVEYAAVFVAQYTGAGRPERVGASLWQALWFCLPAYLILILFGLNSHILFELVGHASEVRELEEVYYSILCYGGGPYLIGVALACFFSGRGMTKPVMLVNLGGAILNVPLDYCLINGVGPFPELGIRGAGIATVGGFVFSALCFALLVFRKRNEKTFKVWSGWRFDPELFRRFLRFGLPGGVQFFLDMFAVSFFVFMVGRIGTVELAASNIGMTLDNVAYLPMVGMSIAVSVMVGQAMGKKSPESAAYATTSVLHIAWVYMGGVGVLLLVFPDFFIEIFRTRGMSDAEFAPILELGRVLLRYVAGFTLLDAVCIIHAGALKGAGDTRFIMWSIGLSSIFGMVLPLTLLYMAGYHSVHVPWACLYAYVVLLMCVLRYRYVKGPWRRMQVIEDEPSVPGERIDTARP
ncbi:MATE family efflux transporter [Pseudodesulfovibrio tunisiensis]|uniref:MATE family efflux transporter n=1 Tax=Pseudodesulfovibrio tunisiensis TaxID=463192 RepID=UPI001FB1CACE|nr:MATE family efflux transporter [Pseudodesulfovibrio tunisiensis]